MQYIIKKVEKGYLIGTFKKVNMSSGYMSLATKRLFEVVAFDGSLIDFAPGRPMKPAMEPFETIENAIQKIQELKSKKENKAKYFNEKGEPIEDI